MALGAKSEHKVIFLSCFRRSDLYVPGVEWRQIVVPKEEREALGTANQPPPLRQGELFADAMLALRNEGFMPHVVHGHVGFGAALYAPDIFPSAMQAGYFEWMYTEGADVAFLGGLERVPLSQRMRQRHSNMCSLSALEAATVGICPTLWQRAQHPASSHHKLHVLHEGVDTEYFSPRPSQRFNVQGVDLDGAEIVTFATRGLEPYRGFHTFYRSLPAVLAARPKAQVLIMADDRSFYGQARADGKTWREVLQEEVELDESRVHFLPFQPYPQYRAVLRASHVHVYLTVPFVLSWSLLEAMSCGCLVVASDTEPVMEVVRHEQNGLLTNFFNPDMLARRIIQGLEDQDALQSVRKSARETVLRQYDLRTLVPRQVRLLEGHAALR